MIKVILNRHIPSHSFLIYMKKISALLLASLCAASLLTGCSGKDGDPGPTGPSGTPGPNLTGNMVGFVNPLDEGAIATTKSGVTVTLEGVTPVTTATTDANGRYEFSALRNGTYSLIYSRAGLGTFRRISIAHVGGDQPTFLGITPLVQISNTSVVSFSFGSPQSGNIVPFTLTLSNPSPNVSLRGIIFVGATPNVSSGTGTSIGTFIANSSNVGTINSTISKATLNSAGLASGITAYAIAYGTSNIPPSFIDPATGRPVFTSLSTSPSSVVSFIVP
jgi:hypothetical protein